MKDRPGSIEALFKPVRDWVAFNYPGHRLRRLSLEFENGDRCDVPAPRYDSPGPTQSEAFIPTPFQNAILDALDGKALRTTALTAATGGDQRRLFRPGGLKELQEQGLVSHHSRLGYFRPDCPPEQLADELD